MATHRDKPAIKDVFADLEGSLARLEVLTASPSTTPGGADAKAWAAGLAEHRELIVALRAALARGPAPGSQADAGDPAAEILRALGSVTAAGEDESLSVALGSLMQLTHAQRGFVVLRGADGTLSFPAARTFAALEVGSPGVQISRTILRTALSGEASVVVVDAMADARFGSHKSVQALALRAVLAIPLMIRGRTWGALYLDNPIRAGAFNEQARVSAEQFAKIIGPVLERDFALRELDREHTNRARKLRADFDFACTIGDSDAIVELLGVVARVAPTDAAVLITGETGTGKELIARNIHTNSRRSKAPFLAINCGALASELVESELFGHEKGSFTGANGTRIGRFEAAHGGTLFLDEVGELSSSAQAKLLRVLADGTFQRVGATDTRRAHVRIIAATNKNLEHEVNSGGFRQDLLYRLNVIPLRVPPLRRREGDIALLAKHFVDVFARAHKPKLTGIHPEAMAMLEAYAWPGNVRELANVVERGVILSSGDELGVDALDLARPKSPSIPPPDSQDMKSAVRAYKRRLVERAIGASAGDNAEAARRLGVNPKYLYQLVRDLELSADGSAPSSERESGRAGMS